MQFSNPACKDVGALGLRDIKMGNKEPRSIGLYSSTAEMVTPGGVMGRGAGGNITTGGWDGD